eukprot:CAMPEP_0170492842 /NCGR_PEP_ID=MMETSP0208-20121228/12968_1 /TAXON_ID=197538 /ORGANISM="Strombidium inclinatum, Strain S3" /LENGTH=150 /DNA_ID=CAMNT_0010768661 /DNA_START=10 /DNA_END=462 /DNA_ORIENTATION=+
MKTYAFALLAAAVVAQEPFLQISDAEAQPTLETQVLADQPSYGAPSDMKPVEDADLKTRFIGYRNLVQMKADADFTIFRPVKYSSQVVAGTNYVILYDIGSDKYLEVKVYQPLPNSNALPSVTSVSYVDKKLGAAGLAASALTLVALLNI